MDIAEKDGFTPVHGAGFQGRADVLKVLHEDERFDIHDVHKDGYQVQYRGLRATGVRAQLCPRGTYSHNNSVPPPLFAAGCCVDQPIHRACWGPMERHTEAVALLIELGVDPKAQGTKDGEDCADMTQNAGTKRLLEKHGIKVKWDEDERAEL